MVNVYFRKLEDEKRIADLSGLDAPEIDKELAEIEVMFRFFQFQKHFFTLFKFNVPQRKSKKIVEGGRSDSMAV